MYLYFCITLLVSIVKSRNKHLDMLRVACPYSSFCSMNSLSVFNKSDDNFPCCFDCFCDEHCSMFGDCCPDYEPSIPKPDVDVLDCKHALIASERTLRELTKKGIIINLEKQDRYRMIDFCPPENYDDLNVINGCNGTFQQLPNLDDLVLVSDKTGRIFRNKHCASCNNVFDVTKWTLKIVACLEDISEVQLIFSEAHFFIFNYCVVTSERPRGIHVTPRMLECSPSLKCENTTHELVDACFNGPKMCSGHKADDICPQYDTLLSRNTLTSYKMLLDVSMVKRPSNPTGTACSEEELVDKYTGKCRRVYCPPFEAISYGRCVPVSQRFTNLFVNVQVIYTFFDSSLNVTATSNIKYNETMKNYHMRKIYNKFGFSKCKIVELFLEAQFTKIIKRIERILLTMTFEINDKCTLKQLGELIKQTKFPEKEFWFLQNRFYKMVGQYSFFVDPPLHLDETYRSDILMLVKSTFIRLASIQRFFLCPYFKYSFKEYLDHMTRSGNVGEEYKLKEMSPSSRYLDGCYPITQKEIVVCVDSYEAQSCTKVIRTQIIYIIMTVVVEFFIIVV